MNVTDIKKRQNEEVACWLEPVKELTPNTVITLEKWLTALVKVDGVTKILMKEKATVYSLLNPGKTTKTFFGNRPYADSEICVIDQSSEFTAEWGLAGADAIPYTDVELGNVDCKLVAFGTYYYKIQNFVNFRNAIPFGTTGKITRDDIREYLRAETTDIIKTVLTSALGASNLKKCRENISAYTEEILERINKRLDSKGLAVYNFVITKLDYDPAHAHIRSAIDAKKINVVAAGLDNKAEQEYVKTEEMKAKNVVVPIMNAAARANNDRDRTTVVCPRCGEENKRGANYCLKCGEKLTK